MTYEKFRQEYHFDESNPILQKGKDCGQGNLYIATDKKGNKVAIKIAEGIAIQDEAKLIIDSNKDNKNMTIAGDYRHYIANYLDSTGHNGKIYIAMEYYSDGSLHDITLIQDEKEEFLKNILKGIFFLHKKNIKHCDLKPANILVKKESGKWTPKICDFGISKRSENPYVSWSGHTPQYASPEQREHESLDNETSNISNATDLWSFGVIAFEVFTGNLPFGKEGWAKGREISNEINDIPDRWKELIKSCLDTDFNKRKTAEECLGFFSGVDEKPLAPVGFLTNNEQDKKKIDNKENLKSENEDNKNGNKSKWSKFQKILLTIMLGILFLAVLGNLLTYKTQEETKETNMMDDEQTLAIALPTPEGNIQDTFVVSLDESTIKQELLKTETPTVGEKGVVVGSKTKMGISPDPPLDDIKEEARNEQAVFLQKLKLENEMVSVGDFKIGKYEVTQRQWRLVMGNNPSSRQKGDDFPVHNVSWHDSQLFIKKLNEKTGRNYRLPTAKEWKYAASGGRESKGYTYSGSNDIDDVAWYSGNSRIKINEKEGKKPNELGLYDMSGNVAEWCSDQKLYGGNYSRIADKCTVTSSEDWGTNYNHSECGFRLAHD